MALPALPHEYAEHEPVLGILTTSPLLLLGMVVVVRGAFVRRARRDDRFTVTAVLVAVALIMVAIVSTSFFGATQRYRVEADLFLTVAAVAAISLVWSFLRRPTVRRVFIAVVGALAVFSVVVAVLAAYHGHMPFSPARNGFGDELAAIGQPIEDVTLADSPYVTVEPQSDVTGPFALDGGFLLQPEGRLDIYARGDCKVRIVLDRDARDRKPVTLTSDSNARIEIHPMRVDIEVPPGADAVLWYLAKPIKPCQLRPGDLVFLGAPTGEPVPRRHVRRPRQGRRRAAPRCTGQVGAAVRHAVGWVRHALE